MHCSRCSANRPPARRSSRRPSPAIPIVLLICLVSVLAAAPARATACTDPLSWTGLAALTGGARANHTAIWDAVGSRMIVYGGENAAGLLGDVWSYNPLTGAWTQLFPSGPAPSARRSHTAIYDSARNRMIVHGGVTSSSISSEVWALSLGGTPAWTLLSTSGGPGGRYEHVAIYDSDRDRMVFFGGAQIEDDTWALQFPGNTWSQLSDYGLIATEGCFGVYDSIGQRFIVGGGIAYCPCICPTPSVHGWSYIAALPMTEANPVWDQTFAQMWLGVAEAAAVFDAQCNRVIVTGGYVPTDCPGDEWPISDTYQLDLNGTPTWSQIATGGTQPAARGRLSAVLDEGPYHRLHMFGGGRHWGTPFFKDDLWRMQLPDLTPPAAIDLGTIVFKGGAIAFWSAPGDDGNVGTAAEYRLKYAQTPLTPENFDATGTIIPTALPAAAGTGQEACVEGLTSGVTYWFAIKSRDESGNWSALSNVTSGTVPFKGPAIYCEPSAAKLYEDEDDPHALSVHDYPNPSSGDVRLEFRIPGELRGQRLDAGIFDIQGRRVHAVASGPVSATAVDVTWDRRMESGGVAGPGVYFLRVRVGDEQLTRVLRLQ